MFRRFEAVFRQHRAGTVADEDWAGLRASMSRVSLRPFARMWWPTSAQLFSPGFRAFVESLQRESAV
jgi:hypothetical protein